MRALTAPNGDFGSGAAGTIENPGVGFIGAGPRTTARRRGSCTSVHPPRSDVRLLQRDALSVAAVEGRTAVRREPSWQGHSIASWTIMGGPDSFPRGGSLKVVTSRLKPGYYWKNGRPYSANAVLTEYFRVITLPDRSLWIRLTQIVEDPDYLTQPWIVNDAFKTLPDGERWSPTPCSVK